MCLRPLLAAAMTLMIVPSAFAADRPALEAKPVTQVTEEGQKVIYDGYTWQRRELAKRLPLDEPWPTDMKIDAQFKRFGLDKPPMPADVAVPIRVLDDVYVVNSKLNLTYLINAGPGNLIIIDPGLVSNVGSILQAVEALGFSRKDIKWVLNTHAHYDHSMADAAFQQLGAKILVGRDDVAAVEKGTLITGRFSLSADEVAHYPTLHVDQAVDDGEVLMLGNKIFTAIRTPGHTIGSTCYLLTVGSKKVLFGGDTILFDYRLGAQGNPFADNIAYLASLKKLANLGTDQMPGIRFDVLLPGHGTIVLDRAYLDVLKGERQVQIDVTTGSRVLALPFGTDTYRKMMFGRP